MGVGAVLFTQESEKPGRPRGTCIQLKELRPDTSSVRNHVHLSVNKRQTLHMNSASPPLCLCRIWVKVTVRKKAEQIVILVTRRSKIF